MEVGQCRGDLEREAVPDEFALGAPLASPPLGRLALDEDVQRLAAHELEEQCDRARARVNARPEEGDDVRVPKVSADPKLVYDGDELGGVRAQAGALRKLRRERHALALRQQHHAEGALAQDMVREELDIGGADEPVLPATHVCDALQARPHVVLHTACEVHRSASNILENLVGHSSRSPALASGTPIVVHGHIVLLQTSRGIAVPFRSLARGVFLHHGVQSDEVARRRGSRVDDDQLHFQRREGERQHRWHGLQLHIQPLAIPVEELHQPQTLAFLCEQRREGHTLHLLLEEMVDCAVRVHDERPIVQGQHNIASQAGQRLKSARYFALRLDLLILHLHAPLREEAITEAHLLCPQAPHATEVHEDVNCNYVGPYCDKRRTVLKPDPHHLHDNHRKRKHPEHMRADRKVSNHRTNPDDGNVPQDLILC
mmetsp:Transcript_162643/g.516710  ORF Transcript_162643/g.516710 Transcript_162643/m.516710 type:complete len:429 (+) Transcript_162643:723-2009(+)